MSTNTDPLDPLDYDRLADIVDEMYEESEAQRRANDHNNQAKDTTT